MKNNENIEKENTYNVKFNKERIEYIDIAKGIGILLMIIGHMPLKNEYIKNFIYFFHMPLFFLISGYFFKYRENKQCLKNIAKRLIMPYVITCIIIIAYKIFRLVLDENFIEIPNTLKVWGLASIYGSGSGEHFGIRYIGAIWFLLALGFATYFMNIIYNKKYRYLWVILIAYIGYETSKYIWLPLSIQAGMVALLFIYLGILAKENDILNKKITVGMYFCLIAIAAFCVKYGGKLYMVNNTYENGLLDIIGALSGTFLCIKISMIIEKNSKLIKKFFIFIGRNSLICMCVHLISLDCLHFKTLFNVLNNIGIHDNCIRAILINIMWVVLVLIIIKIITKIINIFKRRIKVSCI